MPEVRINATSTGPDAPSDNPAQDDANTTYEWKDVEVPEKFKGKSPEDVLKAYQELEAHLGGKTTKKEGDNTAVAADSSKDTEDSPTKLAIPEKNDKENTGQTNVSGDNDDDNRSGINFEKFSQEFMSAGELSEDSYKELNNSGIPTEMVKAYLAGQVALIEQQRTEAFGLVGGEDNYSAMIDWAASNLSEADQNAFNNSMGNGATARLAIQGLYAQYSQAKGREPNYLKPNTGQITNQGGKFTSWAEVRKVMSDPRYKNDESFRKAVSQKLDRSDF